VESSFSDYVVSDKKKRDEAKKQAEENIGKSQEKQKEAYAKKVQKKYKDLIYNVGDEVLLMNMRKRGRKGGRIEPDFSGPYIIERLSGKLVTLNKRGGITLKLNIALVTLNLTGEAKLEKCLMIVLLSQSVGLQRVTVLARCLLALLHLHSALRIL